MGESTPPMSSRSIIHERGSRSTPCLIPRNRMEWQRENKIMVGAAKAMLFDQGLPLFLQAEAYITAVYIQNRCPHAALGRKTPEEVFTSTRPDVSHICIFDSVCYCHAHADNRKKLDPSGEKSLLVGYNEISKAYRVYIPARRRIIDRVYFAPRRKLSHVSPTYKTTKPKW